MNIPRKRLRMSRTKTAAISVLIALLGSVYPALVSPHQARADVSAPSWWNGDCDVTNYPGSYPLGSSFNGVKTCGPIPGTGGRLVNFTDGSGHQVGSGEYEWQCLELSMRYMWLVYGIAPYYIPSGGAYDIVNDYSGTVLTKVTNPATGGVPTPGDILAFAASTYGHSSSGHTSVVTSVSVDGNGNGTLATMEQNASSTGVGSVPVASNVVGGGVTGWLHNPNASTAVSGRMMIIDGSNNAYAEDTLGNNWVQSSKVTGVQAIAVGGNRMMVINSAGAAYSSDSTGGGWTPETANAGAKAIAVGSNGRQMIIDGSNNAFYEDVVGNFWQTPWQVSGAQAIALSGTPRMMTIDSGGTAYAKNNPGDGWQPVTSSGGAAAIAVGSSGRMMIIDGSSHAYAEDTISTTGWTAVVASVPVKAIAVGGSTGRMLVVDTSGNVYFKEGSLSSSLSTICTCGATAVAVGSTGRMMVIDGNGKAWGMDSLSTGWVPLTDNGGAKAIAVG